MTGPVVVRHCVVRVVRHGGWSWGPAPRQLVDAVLRELGQLVADRLADAGIADPAGEPDVELAEPVRIRVSLPLGALAAAPASPDRPRPDPVNDHLPVRSRPHPVADHPPTGPRPARSASAATAGVPSRAGSGGGTPVAPPPPTDGLPAEELLQGLLSELHRRGELVTVIALLPEPTRRVWNEMLAGVEPGDPGRGRPATGQAVAEFRAALSAPVVSSHAPDGRPPGPPDPAGAPTSPSESAAPPAIARTGLGQAEPATGPAPAGPPERRDQPADAAWPAGSMSGAATVPPRHGHLPAPTGTVDVASALPFLLLNPLSRLGWLEALEPALAVTEPGRSRRTGLLAAFATALAHTVLPPLERGWRRDPGAVVVARTFACGEVPEPDLVDCARAAGPALPTVDAVLASAVARGLPPGGPLLLVGAGARAGGGLLLADPDGLLPLAWSDDAAELLPVWRAAGEPSVLVRVVGLGPELLGELEAAGVPFVVDMPPNRHERWRRLPTRERLWTNDTTGTLARGAGFADDAGRLDDLVHALAVQRHAVPLAAGQTLRRSLLLAAAVGLGTIAATLWRLAEPTDPLLALQRLGDLQARVTTDSHSVLVRLPMGRRHDHLLESGLLSDVSDVPWLRGRTLRITAG